jgi:hypothetical protein
MSVIIVVIRFTSVTRRVALVEQKLLALPEHMSSPPIVGGVRVTPSLASCIVLFRSCLILLSHILAIV